MEKNKDNDNVWTSMRNALEKLKEALKCVEDTFSGALDYFELVEQKHDDKVEPKFHEGDWIIHHGTENIYQVVAVIDNQYQLKYGDNYTIQNCAEVDRCARLWDVTKDAKDGDVLATKDAVFIFKHIDKTGLSLCKSYCEVIGNSELGLGFDFSINGVNPATKEQRNLLFQKMKENGYEWDAEKKELKKLVCWSEEDDYNLQCMIAKVSSDIQKGNVGRNNELIDWLKSLKDRVQPHWKPSDEQMEALKEAVDAEIVEVEDNNYSMCAYTHLEICTDEDLSKICKAGDKAKVIIIKQK